MEALRIRIPLRYQSGIAKLVSLRDDSVEELLSALDETPSTFNLDRLKSQITMRLSAVSIDDIDEIIDTLEALHLLHLETELSLESFVEQLFRAIDTSGNENLKLDADARERFKDRLMKLLNGTLLAISARARYALHEYDHVFGRMRITTDIRSLFGPKADELPTAAVIVHTLRLHYIQGQQHMDFFIALNTADIGALIDLLKQAQEKAEALKSTLTLARIPYIDAQ